MRNMLYQVTDVIEKQLDNSKVAWGPVPPVHALSQSIICAVIGEASLTLRATGNFSPNTTTSQQILMFLKPLRKEMISQRRNITE